MKFRCNQQGFHFVLVALATTVLLVAGFVSWRVYTANSGPDTQPILTHNFIDLSKVEKISKYRSCQGHIVVPQNSGESMRNMKHYIVLKKEFQGGNKVDVYSPIDGIVKSTRSNDSAGLEGEIWIGYKNNEWAFSAEHLRISSNIKEGDKVSADQVIGQVADRGIDVVYGTGAEQVKNIDGYNSPFSDLDSVFNHMSNEVLSQYGSPSEVASKMIYTKEYRDQNPCRIMTENNAQPGQLNDFEHPEDWVTL